MVSYQEACHVPVCACVFVYDGRLARSTDIGTECATVRMFIENVFVAANLTSRRSLKSDRELNTTASTKTKLVRHLNRFKPHNIVLGILLVSLKEMCKHGGQILLVCSTRPVIQQVFKVISRIWLIKRVIADYVLVGGETCGCVVPIGNEFVLKSRKVLIKCVESSKRLR